MTTSSPAFPTVDPYQGDQPNDDIFISILNPAGSALDNSTYLGGNGIDWGRGIAVDASGDAYVAGFSASTDFPGAPGRSTPGRAPPSRCDEARAPSA